MTQLGNTTKQKIGSQLARLPFVLLLTVGLLMSLIHCAGCELALAKSDTVAAMSNADSGPVPETPEQMLPCHSGHCLSHVTAPHVTAAVISIEQVVRRLVSGREQFPAALAGLPLFKPPRA